MKYAMSLIFSLLFVAAFAMPCFGHPEFSKALKAKPPLKRISCSTCHAQKKEIPAADLQAFKKNKKAFRNDYGKKIAKLLKGKDVTKRILAAKDAVKAAKGTPGEAKAKAKLAKVKKAITGEFLEALKKVK